MELPEYFDEAQTAIAEGAFAVLADGPLTLRELAARMIGDAAIAERTGLAALAEQESLDDTIWLVGDTLLELDEFWQVDPDDTYEPLADALVARTDLIIISRVFTTRIRADDITSGSLELGPDLLAVDWLLGHNDDVTLNGAPGQRRFDSDTGRADLLGPEGWLASFGVGDLLAVRADGTAIIVEAAPETLADGDAATAALVSFAETIDEESGFEITRPLLDLLVTDDTIFTTPTLPITELMRSAGYENEPGDDWFGRADTDWQPPGLLAQHNVIERIGDELRFGPCCDAAFAAACDAFGDHLVAWYAEREGVPLPNGADIDYRVVAQNLAHQNVADGFAEWRRALTGLSSDATVDFLQTVAATRRADAAAAHYVLGLAAEEDGDFVLAEQAYGAALGANRDYLQPHLRLGMLAFDRGNYATARRHLLAIGYPADAPVFELFPDQGLAIAPVGRNEPCPCGSGRKYKACHQRSGADTAERVEPWREIERKEILHRSQSRMNPLMLLSLAAADGDMDRADELADDPLVEDIARFEAGGLDEFIHRRGGLLPPAEHELAEELIAARRDLYEITAIEPGQSMALRSVTSGDEFTISERAGSLGRTIGDYLLGRVLPIDEGHAMFGHAIAVPLRGRTSLIEVLDKSEHGDLDRGQAIVNWYAALTGPPTLITPDGEPINAATIAQRLATAAPDDGGRLRLGDMQNAIDQLGGDVDVAELAQQITAKFEQDWLADSIPALGGSTPREAADDPTRRGDLLRLLDSIPPLAPGEFGLDPDRLRAALGLDDQGLSE